MKTTVRVAWKDLKFGAKETTISLIIKGDPSDEQILTLTKLKAAGSGFATLASDQMDIDDVDGEEVHEGVKYRVNGDGTVDVKNDPDQLTMDEVAATAEGAEPPADVTGQETLEEEGAPLPPVDDDLPI